MRLAAALLLVLAPLAAAQPVLYDKSEIRFVSKQMGADVEGRFRRWKADVDFRPADPAHSHAGFEIDLASIDLASEESEAELRKRDWFDTQRFPLATFRSTSIASTGENAYDIAGTLAIKGASRDVTVPVRLRKDAAGNAVAEGEFSLSRLAFKVGEGPWSDTSAVADVVTVRVRITLGHAP
jgi:polyisoprenoid-binding protein YceI